jgi:uncharacterized C2H2 Zn-finger protein
MRCAPGLTKFTRPFAFRAPCVLTDHRAVVCPLCAKTIHFIDGQDIHVQFQRHVDAECTPETRKERTTKIRCFATGCHEKLGLSNRIQCKQCGNLTCMSHRHVDDHACPGRPARGGGGLLSRLVQGNPTGRPTDAAPARPIDASSVRRPTTVIQGASAAALVRESAARRVRPGDAAPAGAAPETCPQCGAEFRDVASLVAHAETVHTAARAHSPPSAAVVSTAARAATDRTGLAAAAEVTPAPNAAGSDFECCPTCGASFADVAALVRHVEGHRWEAQRSQSGVPVSTTSAGGGAGTGQCTVS